MIDLAGWCLQEDLVAVVPEVARIGVQGFGGHVVGVLEQVFGGQDGRVARQQEALGGHGLPVVGVAVGVVLEGYLDLLEGEAQALGHYLADRGVGALAVVGQGQVDEHRAVLVHLEDDGRGGERRHGRGFLQGRDALAYLPAGLLLPGLLRVGELAVVDHAGRFLDALDHVAGAGEYCLRRSASWSRAGARS